MTHPSSGVSRLIESNMGRWLAREKLDEKVLEEAKQARLGPYVVISRECGADADEIANLVSDRLHWDLIDRDILNAIAEDFDVSKRLVEFVDESHIAWLTEIFEAWIEGQDFCQQGYIHDLSRLLMIAAQHGNFVMVGRGSQFILPRKFGLFVRLHAPLETRIANIMKSMDMSQMEAQKHVQKVDQQRAAFLKTYFRNDGTEPVLYDLTMDTSRFSADSVAEIIEIAAKLHVSSKN